jgi:tRNA threonylcarbamoyladenosine biosynthesis protein TsaB
MKILGIDTATTIASVAVVEDGCLLTEEVYPKGGLRKSLLPLKNRANHAEILLPSVERLLKKAGLSLREISAFAVSIGPGSFTGLRIGLSTVKGLAYGSNIPVVGVPTLLAIAKRVTDWEGLICPFLDARKKEVYTALFHKKGEALDRMAEDLVCPPEKVIRRIQSLNSRAGCLFVGDGINAYEDLIRSFLDERITLTLGDCYPSTASAVACLGEQRLREKETDFVGPLVPVYLRSSEAELKKGNRGAKL